MLATLAMRRAQAVGAGVAAADDDDVLVLGGDGRLTVLVGHRIAELHAVGPRQELHGLVDAVEFAARDRQVTPCGGTTREHHGVVVQPQLGHGDVDADVDVRTELRALGRHLLQTTVDVALLHLELWDAVAQQAADAVGTLEHRHGVAGTRELLRGSQSGRS